MDQSKLNTKFVTSKDKKMWIKATRDISVGEELFVSYGKGHWLFASSTAFPDFLGLAMDEDRGVVASKPVEKAKEVLCLYASNLWDDEDENNAHCIGRNIRVVDNEVRLLVLVMLLS